MVLRKLVNMAVTVADSIEATEPAGVSIVQESAITFRRLRPALDESVDQDVPVDGQNSMDVIRSLFAQLLLEFETSRMDHRLLWEVCSGRGPPAARQRYGNRRIDGRVAAKRAAAQRMEPARST